MVGDPCLCPYRFSFRVRTDGMVTLVILDAKSGGRLLPIGDHQAIGFVPDQVSQMSAIFSCARDRPQKRDRST